MQFHVIQIGLFLGRKLEFLVFSGPTEQFTSMNNCPRVQGKSNKPPPPPKVCVWGIGEELFQDFTYIFTFIDTHEYANDIILLYDYWMKGLVKLYH